MGAIPLGSPCAYGSRSGGDYSTKYQACNSLGGERRRKGCESAVKGPALETMVLRILRDPQKNCRHVDPCLISHRVLAVGFSLQL